ncbi:MAG: hypothetical protein NTY00_01475 [Deltaproteobacteria bacterium]|nr:hypothetical protein [Deltaproteobacteria bacterium]
MRTEAIVQRRDPGSGLYEGRVLLHLESTNTSLWCAYQGSASDAIDKLSPGKRLLVAIRFRFANPKPTEIRIKALLPSTPDQACTSFTAIGTLEEKLREADEEFYVLSSTIPVHFDPELGQPPVLEDIKRWFSVTGEFFVEEWN